MQPAGRACRHPRALAKLQVGRRGAEPRLSVRRSTAVCWA